MHLCQLKGLRYQRKTTSAMTSGPSGLLWFLLLVASALASSRDLPGALKVLGTGYNVLLGNPDEGLRGTHGNTPRRILQLTYDVTSGSIPKEVEYVPFETCSSHFREMIFESTEKYQKALLEDFEITDDSRTFFATFEFSKSSKYLRIEDKITNDGYVFYLSKTSCREGKARYNVGGRGDGGEISLSAEFATDVCSLPPRFSSKEYDDFLEKWGTHVVVEVEVGAKETGLYYTRKEDLLQSILNDRSLDGIRDELIQINIGNQEGSSVIVNVDKLQKSPTIRDHVTERFEYGAVGGDDFDRVVSLKVASLDKMLEDGIWKDSKTNLLGGGRCPSGHLAKVRDNVAEAITSYNVRKDARSSAGALVDLTVYWPEGTYTLPMVENTTCPSSKFYWSMGWRYQETENTFPNNDWSDPCHLQGPYSKRWVKHSYCTKVVAEEEASGWRFPTGSYCIMKYGNSCPSGFQEGWILWDDENTLNSNDRSGILPEGVYDKDTLIYFCCRDDGSTLVSALFPTDDPFYLFQYSRFCQNVIGMKVEEEFFQWDGDNDIRREKNFVGGMHPRDTGDITGSDHKLHYCYYYPAE